jgi:hypothetical protein
MHGSNASHPAPGHWPPCLKLNPLCRHPKINPTSNNPTHQMKTNPAPVNTMKPSHHHRFGGWQLALPLTALMLSALTLQATTPGTGTLLFNSSFAPNTVLPATEVYDHNQEFTGVDATSGYDWAYATLGKTSGLPNIANYPSPTFFDNTIENGKVTGGELRVNTWGGLFGVDTLVSVTPWSGRDNVLRYYIKSDTDDEPLTPRCALGVGLLDEASTTASTIKLGFSYDYRIDPDMALLDWNAMEAAGKHPWFLISEIWFDDKDGFRRSLAVYLEQVGSSATEKQQFRVQKIRFRRHAAGSIPTADYWVKNNPNPDAIITVGTWTNIQLYFRGRTSGNYGQFFLKIGNTVVFDADNTVLYPMRPLTKTPGGTDNVTWSYFKYNSWEPAKFYVDHSIFTDLTDLGKKAQVHYDKFKMTKNGVQ